MKKPFWSKKWGKNHICGITHARLRPGINNEGIPYTTNLPCGHRFYTSAILLWFAIKSTCPMCREPFSVLITYN